MQVRFLLGPAGSGKTHRCLEEVRSALKKAAQGLPLLLVAPKQTTYQLERRLLEDPELPGYTRLQVLSIERLARFVFESLGRRSPDMLDEEGRVMVLRGLLARKREELKLFRASAKLTGFAQQLSLTLRELQRHELTPQVLHGLAAGCPASAGLGHKLEDLAVLLEEYLAWLKEHRLLDHDSLVSAATLALLDNRERNLAGCSGSPEVAVDRIWVDGFSEWSPQEIELISALTPNSRELTVTFCLDKIPAKSTTWLSHWSVAESAFEQWRKRLARLPGSAVRTELLPRPGASGRFAGSPLLARFEERWGQTAAAGLTETGESGIARPQDSIRLVICSDPEDEVAFAAREIRRHVRFGGRFRDVSVLVRTLEGYHGFIHRVFTRYEIPFFLDRRESVAHHPLAELTRGALRAIALHWRHEDIFAALKTGLVPVAENEIDRLENEALARGWQGQVWESPPALPGDPELESWMRRFHREVLPPFKELGAALGMGRGRTTGSSLAAGIRRLWQALSVEETLQEWAAKSEEHGALHTPASVHATVWEQANRWLENVELAFPREALALREWLPVLESGLTNLSVGVIPPALDQVIVGTVDRSRDPEVKIAYLLGLNEAVFPAPADPGALITETDRVALETAGVVLGATSRRHLARERFLAYIACTRAREHLILTCAARDPEGSPLNPSVFFSQARQFLPETQVERNLPPGWQEAEHATELTVPMLELHSMDPERCHRVVSLPAIKDALRRLEMFRGSSSEPPLSPEVVEGLYSRALRTSVSRLEQFAACPFRFFIHSGLRAEERTSFELDVREQGSFQHEVLALFHESLLKEGKTWRDLTPEEGQERIARIAEVCALQYREGLLQASDHTRFMARVLTESLRKFVGTVIAWMRQQYLFQPTQVELPFGDAEGSPAWTIDLGDGRSLQLRGRIDRVDLYREPGSDTAHFVVVDYKSSQKRLEDIYVANGLQLQLLAYLNVVRNWKEPKSSFGVENLMPGGVFFVSLRGRYERQKHRSDALEGAAEARKTAYMHTGRFDASLIPLLDARPNVRSGDQFNYRLTTKGAVSGNCREAMDSSAFGKLINSVEDNLREMGKQIFSGNIKVDPFRRGKITACQRCDYLPVCRLDPWTHSFRTLELPENH